MKLALETTDEEMRAAYEILNSTRRTTLEVKLPRTVFAHLLRDHARLLTAAEPRVTIVKARAS